jgi:F-type H+-transporting ATPase subunit gamma
MEELEHAQSRLDHIRTVAPILGALRTISLGSWKAALRQKIGVQQYAERLTAILSSLVPHLSSGRRARRSAWRVRHADTSSSGQFVILVVGSERGLCGRFNAELVERAEQCLAEQEATGAQVALMALGTRVRRILLRRERPLAWSGSLSVAALPPYALAIDLARRWLARYEAYELDAVDLVYNAYHGAARYEPAVTRLIPPQLSFEGDAASRDPWMAPIIETDPLGLYARVVEQWAALSLYELLLDSAAAEHSTQGGSLSERRAVDRGTDAGDSDGPAAGHHSGDDGTGRRGGSHRPVGELTNTFMGQVFIPAVVWITACCRKPGR